MKSMSFLKRMQKKTLQKWATVCYCLTMKRRNFLKRMQKKKQIYFYFFVEENFELLPDECFDNHSELVEKTTFGNMSINKDCND